MNQDLNVQIRRMPDSQNYRISLLKITNSQPAECETYICQTLIEVMQRIADFEANTLFYFNWKRLICGLNVFLGILFS